jgi:uncharacterized membrane protein
MKPLPEEKAERAISLVLRYGSLIAAVVMALGIGLMISRGLAVSLPTYHRMATSSLFFRLIHFDPAAVTELGILILLLTPIFRIVVAVLAFALERDLKYVFVSLGVLAVVLLSISFAIVG